MTAANAPLADSAFALVAAVASNGVIGAGNSMPWRLPADLRRFRALTTGHAVVMGRKTWESLPHALPSRQNIVVTRQASYRADGAEVVATLDAALAAATLAAPVFCIGGGDVYRQALPRADTVHLTEIERAFDGDTTFPPLDLREWHETARERHAADAEGGPAYAFVTYRRIAPPARA